MKDKPSAVPAEVELEDVACPMGCPPSDTILFSGRDRLHDLPGEFNVVRCEACSLIRTNPRPTPTTIGFYYPSDYQLHKKAPPPPAPREAKSPLRQLLGGMIDLQATPLPDIPPGHMFEVGCGNGHFMASMAQKGWTAEGLEPSAQGAQNARELGFDVIEDLLETAAGPKQPPDLVVAWMAIEHLHDPIGGLKRLHDWAKPGAYLAASVPNAESVEFGLFKGNWYALQVPAHLFFYTPKTLEQILERAGWRLEKVFHQRKVDNLVASAGNALADRGVAQALADKLKEFPKAGPWSVYATYPMATLMAALGQTGRMSIVARRK